MASVREFPEGLLREVARRHGIRVIEVSDNPAVRSAHVTMRYESARYQFEVMDTALAVLEDVAPGARADIAFQIFDDFAREAATKARTAAFRELAWDGSFDLDELTRRDEREDVDEHQVCERMAFLTLRMHEALVERLQGLERRRWEPARSVNEP